MNKLNFVANYKIKGTNHSSLKECLEYCSSKKYLGLDIETSVNEKYRHLQTKIHKGGLDPFLSSIVLLQIGDVDKQFVIDVRDFSKEELKPLIDFLHLNDEVMFIGQNLKFECRHLLHKYGILFSKLHDTMIAEIILHNGENYKLGLVDLAQKYLNKKNAADFNLFNQLEDRKISLDEKDLEDDSYISPFDLAEGQIINKSTRLEFINIGEKKVTFKQIKYAADDIIDPILIASKQRKGRLLPNGEVYKPIKAFDLENAFIPVVAEMENFGMSFEKQNWLDLHNKNEKEMNRVRVMLDTFVNKNYPKFSGQYDLFTGEVASKIHWTSSKQVVKFFKYLNICPRAFSKQTRRVEDTVGAKDILKQLPLEYVSMYQKMKEVEEIKTLDDLQLMFIIFKKYEQLTTTFGKDWLKYIHPITKKVHPSFVQLVNTGRMACRAPNLQQQPNAVTGHRDSFTLQGEDEWLVNADYSNMEVRCMADRTDEFFMLKFFNDGHEYFGDDFHSYTATLIDRTKYNDKTLIVEPKELPNGGKNKKYTADDDLKRGKSKQTTFGLAFGKGAKGLAEDFRIPEEEAEEFMSDYYNTYPNLQKWFKSQHKFYDKNGYIVIDEFTDFRWFSPDFKKIKEELEEVKSNFGDDYNRLDTNQRRVRREEVFTDYPYLRAMWKNYWRTMSAWNRKSQNAPIQGTAAKITKTAALYFRKEMIKKGVYIKYVNFSNIIHDELIPHYVNNNIISKEEVGKILEESMEKAGRVFNKRVKHIGKAEISKEWAH